jgi:hypothetical protein
MLISKLPLLLKNMEGQREAKPLLNKSSPLSFSRRGGLRG